MPNNIATEAAQFEQAQIDFDNPELRLGAIEAITRLSLTAGNYQLRMWAAVWMKEHVNVTVIQENGNATSAPAEDLYR